MERAVDRLFVTGTDTGVGKTVVSAALLHAFRARGLRAVGMKPVASGCERAPEGWRNEDALALQAASDPRPPYDDVNPYALPAPLAPEIAALPEAAFCEWLTREVGVAAIPLSAFYPDGRDQQFARLCFAKRDETLERALARLRQHLVPRGPLA